MTEIYKIAVDLIFSDLLKKNNHLKQWGGVLPVQSVPSLKEVKKGCNPVVKSTEKWRLVEQ